MSTEEELFFYDDHLRRRYFSSVDTYLLCLMMEDFIVLYTEYNTSYVIQNNVHVKGKYVKLHKI